MKEFNEHILEIRFKPNARVLDKRGEIAEALATPILNQWNISRNRIAFSAETDPDYHAFFSFKNLGIKTLSPHDQSFFLEKAEDFIKLAWNSFPTGEITRIGIRVKTLTEVENFTNVFNSYKANFLGLSDEKISEFGGELVDVGFPLNFIDGKNNFRMNTGPMQPTEYPVHFEKIVDMEKPGVFLDVDYYGEEFSPHVRQKNLIEFIEIALGKIDQIKKTVHGLSITEE